MWWEKEKGNFRDFFIWFLPYNCQCRHMRWMQEFAIFFQFFISYPSFKLKLWGRNWMKLLSGLFSFIRRADEIPQIDDCDKLQPQLEFTYVLCEFCSNFESKRLRRFSCEFECGKLKKLLIFFNREWIWISMDSATSLNRKWNFLNNCTWRKSFACQVAFRMVWLWFHPQTKNWEK